MEKYEKPTIIEETLKVVDIIAVSNVGAGSGDSSSITDLFGGK